MEQCYPRTGWGEHLLLPPLGADRHTGEEPQVADGLSYAVVAGGLLSSRGL